MAARVVILGAGTAGLWSALTLLERKLDLEVTVIESEPVPGGIAGSFEHNGLMYDYGSHRLHPATRPDILERLREILGDDLLTRPRNGRIWLENRFITFPLKPADLLFHLPPSFSLGVLRDSFLTPFRKSREDSFESVLIAGLGKTISRRFYFPYAEKLWGLPPDELSTVQARKRISAGSLGSMAGKVLSSLPLVGTSRKTGIFHYPVKGFGQLAASIADMIRSLGGRIQYDSRVTGVEAPQGGNPGTVSVISGDGMEMILADFIYSTLPLTELTGMLSPAPPGEVLAAADLISYRSMVLCYLELAQDMYTPFDAHYFPGPEVRFSRMSEPKIYRASREPEGRTGLCFEIPCGENDRIWSMSDDSIRELVLKDLSHTALPEPVVSDFTVRRKRNVYPIYGRDYGVHIRTLEAYLSEMSHLITLGRQGLFVHDNTHHTIEMGIAAGKCLNTDLSWDSESWKADRAEFDKHVVVD